MKIHKLVTLTLHTNISNKSYDEAVKIYDEKVSGFKPYKTENGTLDLKGEFRAVEDNLNSTLEKDVNDTILLFQDNKDIDWIELMTGSHIDFHKDAHIKH